MPFPSLRLTAIAVAAALSLSLPSHAADAPRAAAVIPAGDFFNNPDFSAARLSPSGRYLAAKRVAQNGREQLAVIDLTNTSGNAVAYFKEADVGNFAWISEERLLFDTTDKQIGPAATTNPSPSAPSAP